MLRYFIAVTLILPISCFAENAADQCYDHLIAMPALSIIATKIGLPDVTKASFEQMANQDKATSEEKPVIAKYAEGTKICHELDMQLQPSNLHPKARKTIEENHSSKIGLLIDLYNQKISYGEFIKQRQESASKTKRELAEVDREIDEYNRAIEAQNSRAQAMQEARERQAWSDAISGGLKGMSDSIQNRPRAINCNPNGFGGVVCR